MKCTNEISYGPSAQLKIHNKRTKYSEPCKGSIDVTVREANGVDNEVAIVYTCIKCGSVLNPTGFPSDSEALRFYLITRLEEF